MNSETYDDLNDYEYQQEQYLDEAFDDLDGFEDQQEQYL